MDLNDTTDYQYCFACGQQNPFGLHLVFHQEGETVVSDFLPRQEHQGFPGIIHGGIVATVLDEALNRTMVLAPHPRWTMTGRLEIRYRRVVPYGPLLRTRTRLEKLRGRFLQARGVLTLANDETTLLAEAQGTFMVLTPGMLEGVLQEYPGMRAFCEEENAQ